MGVQLTVITRDDALLPVPHIPTVTAIAVGEQKHSGTTLPLTMTCQYVYDEGRSTYTEYIVKLREFVRLNERGLAREVIAGLLGQILGFQIPSIAIVDIPAELRAHLSDREMSNRLANSLGLNFGSEYISHGVVPTYVTKDRLLDAAAVFAFDMLIQNPDRRPEKPNLFQTPDGFILFDHELALPFGSPFMLIGGVPEPWDIKNLAPQRHIFYRYLKGMDISFDEFRAKLETLRPEFIDQINEKIPFEWRTSEVDEIKNYLLRACENAGEFQQGLQEVLR
jgi:hypothetical protein